MLTSLHYPECAGGWRVQLRETDWRDRRIRREGRVDHSDGSGAPLPGEKKTKIMSPSRKMSSLWLKPEYLQLWDRWLGREDILSQGPSSEEFPLLRIL